MERRIVAPFGEREKRRQGRRVADAATERVVVVDDHRSAEDRPPAVIDAVRQQRVRSLFKPDQMIRRGVTPRHVPPLAAERVVLKEDVITLAVVNQPVGVVHPMFTRREMKPRSQRMVDGFADRRRVDQSETVRRVLRADDRGDAEDRRHQDDHRRQLSGCNSTMPVNVASVAGNRGWGADRSRASVSPRLRSAM